MGAAMALAFSDPAAMQTEMLRLLPNFMPPEHEESETGPDVIWWKQSMN